jgi:hypothetical protein
LTRMRDATAEPRHSQKLTDVFHFELDPSE